MTSYQARYGRLMAAVRAKCRRMLRDEVDIDEVVNETFLRFLESGPRLSEEQDTRTIMAWLYRTSTRLSIDLIRRSRRHAAQDLAEVEEALPCGVRLDDSFVARRLIRSLCDEVPEDELAAAVLCRLDGLSQPEAAEVLRSSERTIRRLLQRFDARAEKWRTEYVS